MKKLNYEKEFSAGVEKVWNALVHTDALSDWLMPTNFVAKVGSEFTFRESGLEISGEVLDVVENRRLSYVWVSNRGDEGEAGTPSIVTWNLSPTETGGTCLQLEHKFPDEVEPVVLIESAMNWRFAIQCSLRAFLQGNRRPPVPIVYAPSEPADTEQQNRRAGFRQEVSDVPRSEMVIR